MNKHLILIDEHKMILYGLKAFVESSSAWKVLFWAQGKDDLLHNLEELDSGFHDLNREKDCFVAIVDIKCGKDSGYELIDILKNKIPNIKCVLYSDYVTYGNLMYAFEKGIEGFLSKDSDETELVLALEAVSQGKTYIQQDLMKESLLISNRIANLTNREKTVYDMICDGLDKKDICSKLKISVRTCENYFSSLYSKLWVTDIKEIQEKFGVYRNTKKKVSLVQDMSYTGDGVKILYSNVPEEASVLEIMLRRWGNDQEQVSFMEDDTWGKNHEYYNLGYYIYPFLDAEKEYTFDFIFKSSNREIVDKASINVIPKKGEEVHIKKITRNNILINSETLECTFKENPLPNLPGDAHLCVNIWTTSWQYVGTMQKKFSDFDYHKTLNFYKEINYAYTSVKLDTIKKVLFQFYFSYGCYEWNFFISDNFSFSVDKL